MTAVSYLSVFRRHFAPAIVSTKRKEKGANCPQTVWLFPLWGQKGSGEPRHLNVPGTLFSPVAHPSPATEGIPDRLTGTGGGRWWTSLAVSAAAAAAVNHRVCPLTADCRLSEEPLMDQKQRAARRREGRVRAARVLTHAYSSCYEPEVNTYTVQPPACQAILKGI